MGRMQCWQSFDGSSFLSRIFAMVVPASEPIVHPTRLTMMPQRTREESIVSVIPFPLSRRHKLLSAIVHVLQARQGEAANTAWRDIAKGLLSQLRASGVDEEAAEHEVRSLLYAATAEIERSAALRIH
jgi:hypothetical protein